MPTYAQLGSEPVWRAQTVPPNLHTHLIAPLRAYFNLGPQSIGAPGDNRHLRGRHRSARWCRTSTYCTDRNYATTDARDLRGDQNWYRAIDVGITGQRLQRASRRVDALVRAGRLPALAEWFGTFNGSQVVGWFEGHPSSSDDSHLYHFHGGFWTQHANDVEQLRLLYGAITGEDDDMTPAEFAKILRDPAVSANLRAIPLTYPITPTQSLLAFYRELDGKVDLLVSKADIDPAELAEIKGAAAEGARAGSVESADELAAAVVAQLPTGVTLNVADVEAAVRAAFERGLAPDV